MEIKLSAFTVSVVEAASGLAEQSLNRLNKLRDELVILGSEVEAYLMLAKRPLSHEPAKEPGKSLANWEVAVKSFGHVGSRNDLHVRPNADKIFARDLAQWHVVTDHTPMCIRTRVISSDVFLDL